MRTDYLVGSIEGIAKKVNVEVHIDLNKKVSHLQVVNYSNDITYYEKIETFGCDITTVGSLSS
jgi:hypothetical protein